jgi:hypothetical protein
MRVPDERRTRANCVLAFSGYRLFFGYMVPGFGSGENVLSSNELFHFAVSE